MNDYIKNVGIIVQPFQQISGSKNRKYGGVERVVSTLIRGLSSRGIGVTLYTGKECDLPCKVVQPAGIFSEEFGKQQMTSTQLAAYAGALFKHINQLEKSGKSYDIINIHYDPIAFITLQGCKIPLITTLHGIANEENKAAFGCFPSSNFSAVSKSQQEAYPSNMNFIGFVYNSISKNHPFSKNKRDYLLSVSRIQPDKGQKNAIKIAKKTGLDLIIAGNMVDSDYFDKEIMPNITITKDFSKPDRKEKRERFIENIENYQPVDSKSLVTYLGEITEQERDQIMKHAKALLFPIEWEEPFGLVLVEAGMVGTPVIAFNRGAVPEIVEQGKTGFYGNSINELVEYVKKVDKIDPYDCRKYIEENFNPDKMVEDYIKLYEKIIKKGRKKGVKK